MDDFDQQLKARMEARQAEQDAKKREAEDEAKRLRDRTDHAIRIVSNSAGVVFFNMAERLRLQGLEALASDTGPTGQANAATLFEFRTKSAPHKSGSISATKAPNRDTVVLTARPPFKNLGSLEFDHSDKAGIEREVQEWVLQLLDT